MNKAALIARYRFEAMDRVGPKYLLSDPEVLSYLQEAETEACRRGLILRDESTAAVCQCTVTADSPWIALDPRVIKIYSAVLWIPNEDDPTIFTKITLEREHQRDLPSGWRDETGDPDSFVTDIELGRHRLYPTPSRSGTLHLGIVRLPLEDFTDEPEIPAVYHPRLVDWVIYKAMMNADPELFSPKAGADALARFEGAFGPAVSANDDLWIGNRPNPRRRRTHFF